jgi:phytanoyl-CoA hydroxylase
MPAIAEENDIAVIQDDFDRDGFAVARQLFTQADVDVIRDTFMELAKNGPVEGISEFRHWQSQAYDPADPLAKFPRMMHPHRHAELSVGPVAKKYLLDARLHGILKTLFRDEPLAVQSMFYFKPPGARGQDLHQDNFYLRVKPGTCLAAWVAIDDADEENGGMVCVPNTANLDVACPEKSDATRFFTTEHVEPPPGTQPVPVNLKAGDVLFFNGSVIHGSYPNTSKTRFRRSLIFHYVPLTSQELSSGYVNPMTFDGKVIAVPPAIGGGPCGTLHSNAGAVH